MTKAEFKQCWDAGPEADDGITFDDIIECAVEWGITSHPRTWPIYQLRYEVLKAAGVEDAEEYRPTTDDQ